MAILSIELFERNKCRLSQGGKTSHDVLFILKYNFFFNIFHIYNIYIYDPIFLREDFSGRYCQITYYIGKYF